MRRHAHVLAGLWHCYIDLGHFDSTEFLDHLTKPLARFLSIEAAAGAVLLFFTVAALVLSDSPWASYFSNAWETQIGFQVGAWESARSLRDWINDGFMTLLFLLVSLELKPDRVLGELRSRRMAAPASLRWALKSV